MNTHFKNLLKKPERVFLIIASVFGLLSATLMPVLSVPDENQHFQISYAMFSENKRAGKDLVLNEALVLTSVQQGRHWDHFTNKSSAQHDGVAINTGSYIFDGKTKASSFDLMHLPQALGVLLGKLIYPSLGVMSLMGRLAMLAVYLAALYFIIKKVKYGKWVFVFVACLPIIIQQAASLSYDAVNFIAIFAWVAFIINLTATKAKLTSKEVLLGLALIAFLFVTKANNLLFVALLIAVPQARIETIHIVKKVRSHPKWNYIKALLICIAMVVIAIGVYVMSKKLLAGHEFHPRRLVEILLNTYLWGNLALIDVTTIGIVGQFSNFYYHIPIWVIILTFIVFAALLLTEKLPPVTKRLAITSALLFVGSIILISIGMYYGWAMRPERLGPNADVADGIQGRYFTPLLVLLFPAIAYLQKFVTLKTQRETTIPLVSLATVILLLAIYTIQTWNFFWVPLL